MLCKSCGSENLSNFNGEVAIHFCGLESLAQPIVWVFPALVICLDCGVAQFVVPESELLVLQKDKAADT